MTLGKYQNRPRLPITSENDTNQAIMTIAKYHNRPKLRLPIVNEDKTDIKLSISTQEVGVYVQDEQTIHT